MRARLEDAIRNECHKWVARHNDYLRELAETHRRRQARWGMPLPKYVVRPAYWTLHTGFNPYKVKRQATRFSHGIIASIRSHRYQPAPAVITEIPKAGGGTREVNVFQIPDSALSHLIYKSLLNKNYPRFSNHSYAYRDDRLGQDALAQIHTEWHKLDRVYVAEFDFSKFFDNIHHEYIWELFQEHKILATPSEKLIIQSFLESKSSDFANYDPRNGIVRDKGIPQGTSISLFLANLACIELDYALESLGVRFVRYADDTLVWSSQYNRVVEAYGLIRHYGQQIGAPINATKSEGISLVTKKGVRSEIRSKDYVEYLGYDIYLNTLSIKSPKRRNIKSRISKLNYENLLRAPKAGVLNMARLGPDLDYDYVSLLAQIRRYLYGGLDDSRLRRYIFGAVPHLRFKGLMSYYPLVNDEELLRKLDGWLIHSLKQTLRFRNRIWQRRRGIGLPGPSTNWIDELEHLGVFNAADGNTYDLRIPSFLLVNRALRYAIEREGMRAVSSGRVLYY